METSKLRIVPNRPCVICKRDIGDDLVIVSSPTTARSFHRRCLPEQDRKIVERDRILGCGPLPC